MIETCTTKRMLFLIGILLLSSLIILFFEEYVEDNEMAASRQLRQGGKLAYPDTMGVTKVSLFNHSKLCFFRSPKNLRNAHRAKR